MRLLLILSYIIIHSFVSVGQNWTGNISSDWNNPGNWSTWPLNGQDININPSFYTGSAQHPVISANSVFSPAAILITNNANLTINANLTTQDDVEVIGSNTNVLITGGVFSINPNDGGRFILDNANLTIQGGTLEVDERFIATTNSLTIINGGSLISHERFIVELGATITQNSGQVVIDQVFAIGDGSPEQSSRYILNGGNLSCWGEFSLENELGDYQPSFIQNGGGCSFYGDIIWFGSLPGSGSPKMIFNAGLTTIIGDIFNEPLSTVNIYIELNNSANVHFYGDLITLSYPNDSLVLGGNSILYTHEPCTITNNGVVNASSGIFFAMSNCILNGSGDFQFHNLISENTINHSASTNIKVSGNIENSGVFIPNNNSFTLNGSSLQLLLGSDINFYNLELNNPYGFLLDNSITIQGTLVMTDGILNTSSSNILRISDNATVLGGGTNCFVNGPMIKTGDDPFVFPVGKENNWARFAISAPSSTNSSYRVEYFGTGFNSLEPISSPLNAISILEHWRIEELSAGGPLLVSLYWEDAYASGIVSCPDLSISKWDGNSWTYIPGIATSGCSLNENGFVNALNPVAPNGIFTFGFLNNVTSQNVSICNGETYQIGLNNYSNSGTYLDYLTSSSMEDSIVMTNLNVIYPDASFTIENFNFLATSSTADSFEWKYCEGDQQTISNSEIFNPSENGLLFLTTETNGCIASSECFHVTLNNPTLCNGETFTVGNNTYFGAGNYIDILPSASNLDSIIMTSLSFDFTNEQIIQNENTLSAIDASNGTFQWVICDAEFTPVENATSPDFTVEENGVYALININNACSSISNCISIQNVETLELDFSDISIYPNPSFGDLEINNNSSHQLHVSIINSVGATFFNFVLENGIKYLDLSNLHPGIYLIQIESREQLLTKKIVLL